ncbi:TauD-domain-containing protein [Fistulina hepatica ATCC 64428]|uniref:TauD-domain-containing protein n=1 Tax=Fistulina hepatica ATCC 64428 TaxID=1128425 RepID=A0A0D7AHJ2_9AGAR|nr:TauD-domain-containing protein [Fistulina hepatica ATCC 64428]
MAPTFVSTVTSPTVTEPHRAIFVTSPPVDEPYRYEHLIPSFPDKRYPDLQPFEHEDPGHRALKHENPRAFLDTATSVVELTPALGTEVHGLDLTSLNNDAKDELALEVARRGVIVFRDQQAFIDKGPDYYKEFGRHFGRLHIHPTYAHPPGHPELHIVYRDENTTVNPERDDHITSVIWHSDISFELQPPGFTMLFLLSQPSSGGDTLYMSQVSALKKLSPDFVAFLRTLKAVHTNADQIKWGAENHLIARRSPVYTEHPVVRRHPVTGDEALFVNREFTRRIVGLKYEESEMLLNFLFDHIERSADNHIRAKWLPGTVVCWDNRVTAHSTTVDFQDRKARRHGCRVTPQAERPQPALETLKLNERVSL